MKDKLSCPLILTCASVLFTVVAQNSYYEQISLADINIAEKEQLLHFNKSGNRTSKRIPLTVTTKDKMIKDKEKHLRPLNSKKIKKLSFGEKIKKTLKFPSCYRAQGQISLPYDGIIEPFEAWYCGKVNMSRIDYYYGKFYILLLLGVEQANSNYMFFILAM